MTIIGTLPFLLQNGTTADATEVDADFQAIVDAVNLSAAHNGANSDITSLSGLTTPITQAQGGTNVWVDDFSTSTGTPNAQIVNSSGLKPTGFSLTQGNRIAFLAGYTNTGPMTLNVGGTGATVVLRQTPSGPVACTGGEVVANNTVEAIYDVFGFVLLQNGAGINVGPYANLASATTTDLGSVPSHNLALIGVATITSFGSSATPQYPIYNIYFAGAMTLVHSANLFLLGEANIITAAGDTGVMVYAGAGAWFMTAYARQNGQPLVSVSNTIPTTQVFTSGSGTYTPSSVSVRYIVVRAVGGGGGGGGGQNATPATSGGATTFGALTASGGAGGSLGAAGAGGGASGGFSNSPGGSGGPPTPPGTAYNGWGGTGGSSQLGGGGAPSIGSATGSVGATNTGAGGGGGGATNGSMTGSGGAGGGGGGCTIGIMAATTYSYAVGASGAGAAGASSSSSSGGNGGAGAAGKIEVIEYY